MKQLRLCTWQILVCLLGMLAGFVPGVSFTGLFTGMDYMGGGLGVAADDRRARVTRVEPGSPADRIGFRSGDIIQKPEDFEAVSAAVDAVRRGERRAFTIRRDDNVVRIDVVGVEPELAAIWYADEWYPIAGGIFLIVAITIYATSPVVPAPWWRTIPVVIIGLGIGVGFALAMAMGNVFTRFRVYQRWPMGGGHEWYFYQGWIGLIAGVLLAVLAAAEIRRRLATRGSPT